MEIIKKATGNFLEDFRAGQVFRHKRGKTITAGLFNDFTDFAFTTNPLSKNVELARLYGYEDLVCPPGLVMNVTFSQTVEDISENARANLGYENMRWGVPVYVGDTIEVETTVLSVKPSSSRPDIGVVSVQSTGYNQRREVVLTFRRAVQIWKRDKNNKVEDQSTNIPEVQIVPAIPNYDPKRDYKGRAHLTTADSYFEDFKVGTTIEHSRGRVVTDAHVDLTGKLDNTSQIHCNQHLINLDPDKFIGGKLLVYGGLPFNFCLGLSCADVGENALSDVIYHSGKHVAPIFVGDTVFCATEIKAAADYAGRPDLGLLQTILRGHKFVKESADWKKVEIFYLERDLAVKRRAFYA